MSAYEDFLKERIKIGAGMVAGVYAWNGYAYKCFGEGYPEGWIAYEIAQQNEVCRLTEHDSKRVRQLIGSIPRQ